MKRKGYGRFSMAALAGFAGVILSLLLVLFSSSGQFLSSSKLFLSFPGCSSLSYVQAGG